MNLENLYRDSGLLKAVNLSVGLEGLRAIVVNFM